MHSDSWEIGNKKGGSKITPYWDCCEGVLNKGSRTAPSWRWSSQCREIKETIVHKTEYKKKRAVQRELWRSAENPPQASDKELISLWMWGKNPGLGQEPSGSIKGNRTQHPGGTEIVAQTQPITLKTNIQPYNLQDIGESIQVDFP